MTTAELLATVVIVTLLVAGVLLGTSILGRRLGNGRVAESRSDEQDDGWFFVRFFPGDDAGTQ